MDDVWVAVVGSGKERKKERKKKKKKKKNSGEELVGMELNEIQ